jgi:CheY-like chemotaxis protein
MAKILVVDDDRDAGETLVRVFETAGHEAIYVPNGREALAQVLNAIPDVVLLDLAMPEMDGPSFLDVVRSYLRLQSLPVVVLTGLAESPMVSRAQALKVNSVLVKGKASPEEIVHAVQEALARMPG